MLLHLHFNLDMSTSQEGTGADASLIEGTPQKGPASTNQSLDGADSVFDPLKHADVNIIGIDDF